MTEAVSSWTGFQVFLACFGAGGFFTGGSIVFWFGRKTQKICEIDKDLKAGEKRFQKIEDTLHDHGETLARIDERTEQLLSK